MKKCLIVLLVFGVAFGLAAQDYMLDPNFGDVELESGFQPDPYEVDLLSGGSVDLETSEEIDIFATGYVSEAPDVDFYYESDGIFDLTFWVDGYGEDTILLINGPDGSWYFDDDSAGGVDPEIVFPSAEGGLYSIWIGSYYDDEFLDVTLLITEL